jgi:hypothetical protein
VFRQSLFIPHFPPLHLTHVLFQAGPSINQDLLHAFLEFRFGPVKKISPVPHRQNYFVDFVSIGSAQSAIAESVASQGIWVDFPEGYRVKMYVEARKPKGPPSRGPRTERETMLQGQLGLSDLERARLGFDYLSGEL